MINEYEIYNWIGFILVWTIFSYWMFEFLSWITVRVINFMSTKINMMWKVFEYFYYREDFKDWIKDKERHPKVKRE